MTRNEKELLHYDMELLKNELDLQKTLADNLLAELVKIDARSINGRILKKDEARVKEIQELLEEKYKFVERAREEIRRYYRPAMVINPEPVYGVR